MDCQICASQPATHRARYDTPNGRADNRVCLSCLAGRLHAYPQNPTLTPKDFQEFEIMPPLTEEEMEELVASKDWSPYWLEMTECRKGNHKKCKGEKQPSSHIDPHPTICICDCHPDPDGERKRKRENLQGFPDDPEEEDAFVFDDDDDDELLWTDDDEEELSANTDDDDDWEDDDDWDDDDFDF